MADEIVCGKEKLHEYQFKEILETQEEHSKRIKVLEENKIEMKMEFMNIKKELSDQKALTLDLDRQTKEKTDRLFAKVLDSQDNIMKQIVEAQNLRTKNEGEISLKKIVTYGGIIIAIITSATNIVMAILK
jgi:hypothetical protein